MEIQKLILDSSKEFYLTTNLGSKITVENSQVFIDAECFKDICVIEHGNVIPVNKLKASIVFRNELTKKLTWKISEN